MADLNIALILRLVDKATGPARAALRAIQRIGGEDMMRNAERVRRGSVMMADGLGTVAGRATRVADSLTSVKGLLVGLGLFSAGRSAINAAAQFERFNVQLTNLEGSQEGAKKAMGWIEDFATRTPLAVDESVAAYARLKAFGIDPTNGSMLALVDTMAATGGDVETMNGLVLAFGQAWTKGKLQGEEAMQMLERGVPVWDILAKSMGKTTAEVVEMSSQGKLGREEIKLLMDELGRRNGGAAEGMSKTWGGVTSNLGDMWSKFMRMVMDAGVFDFLKDKLQTLLTFLQDAEADGRLQAWAEQTGATILWVLKGLWAFGKGLYETWQQLWPVLNDAAQTIGGWDNVAMIAGLFMLRGTIFALLEGIGLLVSGMGLVAAGMLGIGGETLLASSRLARFGKWLGPVLGGAARAGGTALRWVARTALSMATGALPLLAGAIRFVGRALLIAGRAALANPLMLVLVAIAGLAYVIYDSWDNIVAYFTEKIDRVRAAFDEGLLNGVLKLLSEFNPFILARDAAEGLFTYLTGWTFADVTAALLGAFDIDLVDKGIAMIQSLWDGIKMKIGEMTAWVSEQLSGMMPDWMQSGGPGSGVDTSSGYDAMGNPTGDVPGRALGGPVRAGQIYRWQEEGEEMFVPRTDGTVISNRQLRGMGGGRSTQVNLGGITINAAPGLSARDVAREVTRALEAKLREARMTLSDGGAYAN
jgi:tape measure domain-containing protein